ncbi:alcohol dehydrogenase [Penicillium angulare]|uniref:alcohol dehydrogenase n=1 Tax=Penicillium angulare TaxID=116970 RepID=UPI0025414113|nr:alcohol dehydrogenase [Penicillium angulare]KAJ5292103.1 alcohol dehydrogenase [Penicillium angulare]
MQALRLHGKRDSWLTLWSQCAPTQVRVEVEFCGICGSDIHEYLAGPILAPAGGNPNEHTGATLPVIMGHEMSGTITELGEQVKGFTIGQKVVVNPLVSDFEHGTPPCLSCLAGRINTCKRATFYGINTPGGGFSSQITVNPSNLILVPENVSLKIAALAEPLAVATHMIRKSGFTAGQSVLILGAGPIGLALLMLLRSMEVGKIFVSEVSDLRIQQARQLGADAVIDPTKVSSANPSNLVLNAIHEVLEEGVDISFDASGLQSTLETAIAAVRPGGAIFNVAIHEKPLLLNLNDISVTEKNLTGGICYTKEDFELVMTLLSNKRIAAEHMITSVVPLTDVVKGGFLELIDNKTQHVKILIQPTI